MFILRGASFCVLYRTVRKASRTVKSVKITYTRRITSEAGRYFRIAHQKVGEHEAIVGIARKEKPARKNERKENESTEIAQGRDDEPVDDAMRDLANAFEQVSIPKEISFGRGKKTFHQK
jgi:hypothetical protein